MNISVIGTGYVGLVSGTCLAEVGHRVTCVDLNARKVDLINEKKAPIYEKGLDELLDRNAGHRLTATQDLRAAVLGSDLSLIAVGTPFDGDEIDLSYIEAVAHQIGTVLREKEDYHVVVVKSTVVPGTTDDVVRPILEDASGKTAGVDFGIGMNPEFLREGEAIEDFMNPDRIVLGGLDERTRDVLGNVYAPFDGVDVLRTSNRTAEMIKYTANSLLATLISFSNEIGNLCSVLGDIDVTEVMAGVHLDKRLSPLLPDGTRVRPGFTKYLEAGCGFGGSCFPKDVKALIAHGTQAGAPMHILDAVVQVNQKQPHKVMELLRRRLPELHGCTVAVLGVAFKPGTDDIRESPTIPVVQALKDEGADVRIFDPVAQHEAETLFRHEHVQYAPDLASAVTTADAVLIMTRWPAFAALPALLDRLRITPVVVDGRRMLDPSTITNYEGIGRSLSSPPRLATVPASSSTTDANAVH
jgi:UDPglucose 6-dehydrogenase/GDP-mannose 6-dehydrogenase